MKPKHLYQTIFFAGLLLLSFDGFAAELTISGKVFHDRNKNSELDAPETGIARIYIRLFYKPNSGRWQTMLVQTDSNGAYSFSLDLMVSTGVKYTVLEVGVKSGPAVASGIDPKDFNYNDTAVPGGFNGTTTLRRISRPVPGERSSHVHNFGHANFATFSPSLPNALAVGKQPVNNSFNSPSVIYSIDLATGVPALVLDTLQNKVKGTIAGLGYHQKSNIFMGCVVYYPEYTSAFVLVENTTPLLVTKLPLGENMNFYVNAYHQMDINANGFMVDLEAGTGYRTFVFDLRPTSVNYLQRVDAVTKNFAPNSATDLPYVYQSSDQAFNPTDGYRYSFSTSGGGKLTRQNLVDQPVYLGPVTFETGEPIQENDQLLVYFDNTNHMFVYSKTQNTLFKIDVTTLVANKIIKLPSDFQISTYINGASNPNVTIAPAAQALRYGESDFNAEKVAAQVLVKPNPVDSKTISIVHQFGINAVDLLTASGQRLMLHKGGGAKSTNVPLPPNITRGLYIIRITGSDGKVFTKNIFVE